MISQLLDQLAEYQAQKDAIILRKQEAMDSVLTAEIKAKLTEIEAEFSIQSEGVDTNISELTNKIKTEVIAHGESVKGTYLHAVYARGRISWDTKKLDGLMILIPQLAGARKEGEPSVSIRKI
jgi:hypothetical protein